MTAGPRSVVVTGSGQGLGRAILERLSDDGWATVGLELEGDELRAFTVHLRED